MNVININSNISLPSAVLDYAADVIAKYDTQRVRTAYDPGCISDLLDRIPILLVDVATQKDVTPNTDLLGFYTDDATFLSISGPAVGLCLERIKEHTGASDRDFMYLVTKVLIHEFAHALMAMTPQSKADSRTNVYKAIEEPLANMITLQYLASYDDGSGTSTPSADNSYTYARHFMQHHQPTHYCFGVTLYDLGIHEWWLWRSMKALIIGDDQSINDACAEARRLWTDWAYKAAHQTAAAHDDIRSAWWQLLGCGERPHGFTIDDLHAAYNNLFSAITTGCTDTLVAAVATPYVDVGIEDKDGKTALHRALTTNDRDVAGCVFVRDTDTVLRLFKDMNALKEVSAVLGADLTWLPAPVKKRFRSRGAFGGFD